MKRKIVKLFKLEGTLYVLCDDNSVWYRGRTPLEQDKKTTHWITHSKWFRIDVTEVQEGE